MPLQAVAHVYEGGGPNTINRENARRRIVVRVNTLGRDLGSAVAEIKQAVQSQVQLQDGYFIVYGGQFEAQQAATERILWLSIVAILVVMVVLYSTFPSLRIVVQILVALPAAFVGGILALLITNQTMSVAAAYRSRIGATLSPPWSDSFRWAGLRLETDCCWFQRILTQSRSTASTKK